MKNKCPAALHLPAIRPSTILMYSCSACLRASEALPNIYTSVVPEDISFSPECDNEE
ncbi:MAG: hypothetical protein KQH63_20405 [Desulfobulbaceae bacterium]|nr:hypothetical protein [Desulfobulbaceae bacterium]